MAAADPSDGARAAAAAAAVELVEPGMALGLGSGRAVWKVLALLSERFGVSPPLRLVTASERTKALALDAGFEVVDLDGVLELDLALDGADEIDPALRLIKGGGGALLREKIVVSAARRFVVVAETPKRVERLGERFRLPVEVVRFGWRDTCRRLSELLEDPQLRGSEGDTPFLTDEGHYILDCLIPGGADVDALGVSVKQIPGVVEHGLFIGLAERALLGTPEGGVEVLEA